MKQHACAELGAVAVMWLSSTATAQPPAALEWREQIGDAVGREYSGGLALAPDGSLYVSGSTEQQLGAAHFGSTDGFVARFDAAGSRQWLVQFGSAAYESATAVVLDSAGGVYIAGTTEGAIVGNNSGRTDAFVIRMDASGQEVWRRQLGTAEQEIVRGAAPDGVGGIIVLGDTAGSIGHLNLEGWDIFLLRYDAAGTLLWTRQLAAPPAWGFVYDDHAGAVAADGAGGVYVGGYSTGPLEPGTSDGAFIARIDSQGQVVWLRQFAQAYSGTRAVAADPTGGVYIAGVSSTALGGTGSGRIFVGKYSAGGERLWVDQFYPNTSAWATALAVGNSGRVYLAGTKWESGRSDQVFLAEYQGNGARRWLMTYGGSLDDYPTGLAVRGDRLYLAETTRGFVSSSYQFVGDAFASRFDVGCYANCDGSTSQPVLNVADFTCFLQRFSAGDIWANCDGSTGAPALTILDMVCYMQRFAAGCPQE